MPSSFNGIGTGACRGRGFVRWKNSKGAKADCDGLECFIFILVPIIPYKAYHFYNWRDQSYREGEDEVKESNYKTFPLRWSSGLVAATFLRYWSWFGIIVMALTLSPIVSVFLLTRGELMALISGLVCVGVTVTVCTGPVLLSLADRRDQGIRLLMGRHRYGSSDPRDWPDDILDTLAGPRHWYGTDSFADAVEDLLEQGFYRDAMWAARLTVALESPKRGEALTNIILADGEVRQLLQELRQDPSAWPELIECKSDRKLPLLAPARAVSPPKRQRKRPG